MKITIDIGGKDYGFELNRATYKQLLADEEYSKMQNELSKRIKSKQDKDKEDVAKQVQEEMADEDVTKLLLNNLIMEEKVFYFSLLHHQPEMTMGNSSELLDIAIEEYGAEEVSNLITTLMQNFTLREEKPKKKMVMRMG